MRRYRICAATFGRRLRIFAAWCTRCARPRWTNWGWSPRCVSAPHGVRSTESGAAEAPIRVEVEAPEAVPPLPAAVEVAAYRIAEEALTNVLRHACARNCRLRVGAEDAALCLEIVDDGVGLPAGHTVGVGLRSMRERAEELGGTIEIGTGPQGGTRIWARLPLARQERDGDATHSDR